MNGTARVDELLLLGGQTAARISCESALVPSPGRYTLAHAPASAALLGSALFQGESSAAGFVAAPPIPSSWLPGTELNVRGPVGHGFVLPAGSRRIALVAHAGVDPLRLLPLAHAGLAQDAAVTLVCDDPPDGLPLQLEVQPSRALRDVCSWCDYAACDVTRANLEDLVRRLDDLRETASMTVSQVLVRTDMPCAGLAECGVCTIRIRRGHRLACVDGPVIDARLLLGSR
jgi:hypothetical protein